MKANKITLKKIRLNYLESMVNSLENDIDWKRRGLQSAQEDLEEAMTATFDNEDEKAVRDHDRNVSYYNDAIAQYELEIKEGEKLLAELEKMV